MRSKLPPGSRLQYIVFQLLLFFTWLVFAGGVTPATVITGIPIVVIPVLLFRHTYRVIGATLLFARTAGIVRFIVVTALAIVRASIRMALYSLRPSLPLRSAIISYEPQLFDRLGLTILSLAITVTPGTIVIDRDEGFLYVHVLTLVTTTDSAVRSAIADIEAPLARALHS